MDQEQISQEQPDATAAATAAAEEQMAAWIKYASPGDAHRYLEKMEGTWEAKGKFWMHPGAEPTESTGRFENEMILGGRFLLSRYSGEMMENPFEGLALDGFDNHSHKYNGLWIDSMGTLMMTFEGECNDDGTVRTMIAEFTDPMTGQPTDMKAVTTLVSDAEQRYEGWNRGPDGEYYKSMEIVMTRSA